MSRRNLYPHTDFITPEEAVKLIGDAHQEEMFLARDIFSYAYKTDKWNELGYALVAIYNAGRIQGIREERHKKASVSAWRQGGS